jgi:hypothetical protein
MQKPISLFAYRRRRFLALARQKARADRRPRAASHGHRCHACGHRPLSLHTITRRASRLILRWQSAVTRRARAVVQRVLPARPKPAVELRLVISSSRVSRALALRKVRRAARRKNRAIQSLLILASITTSVLLGAGVARAGEATFVERDGVLYVSNVRE